MEDISFYTPVKDRLFNTISGRRKRKDVYKKAGGGGVLNGVSQKGSNYTDLCPNALIK